MYKRPISIIIFVVMALIIVVAITFAVSSGSVPATPVKPVATTTQSVAGQSYTLTDVTKHNTAADCWTAINGGVYSVTAWISKHPGGAQAIIGLCGIDGSAAFDGQHGGERRPATELASFKIGDLAK